VNGAAMCVSWNLALPHAQHTTSRLPLEPDGVPLPASASPLCAGELVAAATSCGQCWLEIADVIISLDGTPQAGPGAADGTLAGVLARFRGCAIAAIDVADACCVQDRGGATITIAVCGAAGPKLLAGACLAHAWLAAGQPLAALDGARFRAAFRVNLHGLSASGHCGDASFWLSVTRLRSEAGLSVSSRERTWSAWGDPRAS
jgi:hypothetical protein